MPTPMSVFAEIAARYGIDPSDQDAVEQFLRKGVPHQDQQAITEELLLRQVPLASSKFAVAAKSPTAQKTRPLSKSEILQAITDSIGEDISRQHVKQVIETLVTVGHRELKKSGIFVLPGFAKFVVVKKPARPAHKGINPFTKEKQMFRAKPASKAVRAKPAKAVRDALI